MGEALKAQGGLEAMQLRVAESYIQQFGKLASQSKSTLIVSATASDLPSMIAMATSVLGSTKASVQAPATNK